MNPAFRFVRTRRAMRRPRARFAQVRIAHFQQRLQAVGGGFGARKIRPRPARRRPGRGLEAELARQRWIDLRHCARIKTRLRRFAETRLIRRIVAAASLAHALMAGEARVEQLRQMVVERMHFGPRGFRGGFARPGLCFFAGGFSGRSNHGRNMGRVGAGRKTRQ